MGKNLLKVLCLGSVLILAGCDGRVNEKRSDKRELKVGETMVDDCFLTYAGMNSSNTFSLSYGASGANLYYPSSSEIIHFCRSDFDVISVTPEKIILQKNKK